MVVKAIGGGSSPKFYISFVFTFLSPGNVGSESFYKIEKSFFVPNNVCRKVGPAVLGQNRPERLKNSP